MKKVKVLSSRYHSDDVGEVIELTNKAVKVKWPDGMIGIYSLETNQIIIDEETS